MWRVERERDIRVCMAVICMDFALFVDGRKERRRVVCEGRAREEDEEEKKRKICRLGARRAFYDAR